MSITKNLGWFARRAAELRDEAEQAEPAAPEAAETIEEPAPEAAPALAHHETVEPAAPEQARAEPDHEPEREEPTGDDAADVETPADLESPADAEESDEDDSETDPAEEDDDNEPAAPAEVSDGRFFTLPGGKEVSLSATCVLDAEELAVAKAIDNAPRHYAMNALCVTRFYTEATDGYRLHRVYALTPRPEGFADMLLPAEVAKDLPAMQRRAGGGSRRAPAFLRFIHVADRDERSVTFVVGEESRTFKFVEGQWPITDAVIPKGLTDPKVPTVPIDTNQFSGRHLAEAADMIERVAPEGTQAVRLLQFEQDKGLLVVPGDWVRGATPPRAFALIMPV